MRMDKLTVGPVQTCCYILYHENGQECIVIDPGDEPERIRKRIGDRRIAAILLTHGHFDHIGGVTPLMAEGTRLMIHPLDEPMLNDPDLNAGKGLLRRSMAASVTGSGRTSLPGIPCSNKGGEERTCPEETSKRCMRR